MAPSPTESSTPASSDAARRFRRNRQETAWFVCVICLGAVFGLTLLSVLVQRLRAAWDLGQPDVVVDGLWILACAGIFVVLGLAVREFVRFLRKRVSVSPDELRVGELAIPWWEIVELREARQFRSGAWFYHLELRTIGGQRAWITSGLIADYPGLRAAVLEHRPDLGLTMVAD